MISTEHFNIRGVLTVLMVFPRWLPSGDLCRNELKYSRFCLAGKGFFSSRVFRPRRIGTEYSDHAVELCRPDSSCFLPVKFLESLVRVQNNFCHLFAILARLHVE